jgi:hypothetical protein
MTPEQLDQAKARYAELLAAQHFCKQPPMCQACEESVERIAALFDSIRLRMARDKARAAAAARRAEEQR